MFCQKILDKPKGLCYSFIAAWYGLEKCAVLPQRPTVQRDLLKEVIRMYAVIKTGGKQYSVKVGDVVYVEKLNAEADSEVTFDQVLAVGEEGAVKVGAPVVEGASVTAKVVKNGKGKKLNILTYRPKKGSMVRKGHRQPYTKVEITAING